MKLIDLFESVNNFAEKPKTKFSKKQLVDLAKNAGHQLFDSHGSGLIWSGNPEIVEVSSMDALRELLDSVGDEITAEDFVVGDFEYVIKPSEGTGLDASTYSLVTDWKKMVDKDGNIYLVDNTNDTLIRILKPTIKSEKDLQTAIKLASTKEVKIDEKALDLWKKKVLKYYDDATFDKPNKHDQITATSKGKTVGVFTITSPNSLVKANTGTVFPYGYDANGKEIWTRK